MINRTKKHQYNIDKIINKYEYISFDIFDTLVKRNVEKPSDIFNLVEVEYNKQNNKKIKNFKQLRIQAEIKAKEIIEGNEPNIDDIYEMLEIDGDKNQIKELELETELKFIQKNKDFYEIYKYCKNNGKKIIIVSDMYLDKKFIEMILKDNGIDQYEKLFISNDIKLNKHSGSIFPFILKKLKISRKNIIHIGDSKRGDYIMPMLHGIKSILIPKTLRKTKYCNDEKIKKSLDYNVLETFINNNIPYEEDIYFKIGYETLGPILYGYTKWLISQLKEKNIGKIFFLAREGNLLKRSFDIINEEKIESKYLYVSRRSVRPALLDDVQTLSDLYKIIKIKNTTTVNKFLKDVGLNSENFEKIFLEYDYDLKSKINDIKNFDKIFNKIKDDIRENAIKEKNIIDGYLKQEGFNGIVAISDVGWAGSMQKALCEMYKDYTIYGYYIAKTNEIKEIKKYAFMNDYQEIRPFVHLFENLFLAQHGTTLKYKREENQYEPVLDEYEYSNVEKKYFMNIQNGALEFIKDAMNSKIESCIRINNEIAHFNILKLGLEPTLDDIKIFENIPYIETVKRKMIEKKSLIYYLFNIKRLKQDFFDSGWKIGFLKSFLKLKLPYFKLYSFLLRYKEEK